MDAAAARRSEAVADAAVSRPAGSAQDAPVPARAEVVIVGGGVMGTSIAWHLAVAGVRDVVVLEADSLGGGSSGKPLGGVRAQFSSAANVRLGARSLVAYRDFGRDLGVDIGLHQVGYLFCLRTPEDVSAFEASVAMQNDLGVPSRMVSPAQARDLNPYLQADGVLAAAFCAQDGYAHPGSVVRGYADAARRLGVQILTGTPVTGIDVSSGTITAVVTPAGTIGTGTVVCAAGAWSAAIGAMAGVGLPVQPVRRQIALSPPLSPRPATIPFTIDFDSTFYVHNAGDGLLLGLADPDQPVGFDVDYDDSWLPMLRAAAARCVPQLADVPLEHGWAGLYELTPDANALIGRSTDVPGFLYATGFSGHGFLQAPAVGEVIRDLHLGVTPFCDVSGFDAGRFGRGDPATELNIV